MGQSTISFVLQEVITTFNVIFKNLITWPFRNKMEMVMQGVMGMKNYKNRK